MYIKINKKGGELGNLKWWCWDMFGFSYVGKSLSWSLTLNFFTVITEPHTCPPLLPLILPFWPFPLNSFSLFFSIFFSFFSLFYIFVDDKKFTINQNLIKASSTWKTRRKMRLSLATIPHGGLVIVQLWRSI